MTTATATTDNEALQLSAIYRRCLDDLEGMGNFDLRAAFYDQAVERINDAVGEALTVVSQRCKYCDSSDISVHCNACTESW